MAPSCGGNESNGWGDSLEVPVVAPPPLSLSVRNHQAKVNLAILVDADNVDTLGCRILTQGIVVMLPDYLGREV
jgi:hypothetical protein